MGGGEYFIIKSSQDKVNYEILTPGGEYFIIKYSPWGEYCLKSHTFFLAS